MDYGTLQLAESPDGWMGNRDTRPYGSYRRSRRLPTTEVVRREQVSRFLTYQAPACSTDPLTILTAAQRKAVMKDKPWILGAF